MKLRLFIDFSRKTNTFDGDDDPDWEKFKTLDISHTVSDDMMKVFNSWLSLISLEDDRIFDKHTDSKNWYQNMLDTLMDISYGTINDALIEVFGFTDEEIRNGIYINDVWEDDGHLNANVEVYVE